MAKQTSASGPTTPRRRQGRHRTSSLGWFARAAALAALVWIGGFIVFMLSLAGPAAPGNRTEGVAVLTGGPGRLARGVDVMEAGLASRMLVSGVDRSVTPGELVAATRLSPKLLACCVDLGFEADSTRSNAEEVAGWVARHKYKSIRLVTAGYHMPRARTELEARLPADVQLVPDGVAAGLPLWSMLIEYGKFQVSWLLLRVRPA
ncbi:MAG: YdcF family protein [Sandaracinobacteroides sp.]